MAERSDDLLRSRQEAALLLRLDPQNLSASDALRCDLVGSLRLVVDDASATVLDGRAPDLARLLTATETLIRLLPSEPPKPAANHADPRQVMWEIYKTMRERGEIGLKALPEGDSQHRIDALTAEVATLRSRLGLPAKHLDGSTAIDPPTCDIVPASERAECDAGHRAGPDDPPPRSTRIIDGRVAPAPRPPAAPAARTPAWDNTAGGKAWQAWVDAGGAHYDRWGNHNE
jgi:hypothetical protein